MKRLIIVRHGNTFRKGDITTRIGAGTDLPLVELEKGRRAGRYLIENNIVPTKILAAPLKRTMQTAELIKNEMNLGIEIDVVPIFTEIHYGIDENKTDDQVIERLGRDSYKREGAASPSSNDIIIRGKDILDKWNSSAIVPAGWHINTTEIIEAWTSLARNILPNETVLLVSSNGIIRFAPFILAVSYEIFCSNYDIKVKTGSIGIFTCDDKNWVCSGWNILP
jgi:probable phosphoglycerate mutase